MRRKQGASSIAAPMERLTVDTEFQRSRLSVNETASSDALLLSLWRASFVLRASSIHCCSIGTKPRSGVVETSKNPSSYYL